MEIAPIRKAHFMRDSAEKELVSGLECAVGDAISLINNALVLVILAIGFT